MAARGRETIAAFREIMLDPHLAPELKTLWGIYRSYDHKGNGSWPGDDRLAEHMGKSVRSVQGYRAELMRLGYLEQKKRGPRPAVYRAVIPNAPPTPALTVSTSDAWWEEHLLANSTDEVVRATEQMIRMEIQHGRDGVPGEMRERWGALWDAMEWFTIRLLVTAARKQDPEDWSPVRRQIHREIAATAQRLGWTHARPCAPSPKPHLAESPVRSGTTGDYDHLG